MNTAILVVLINNPSLLFGKFIIEPLPGAALAYGLVWLVMRPKDGSEIDNILVYHSIGLIVTVIGSSIFRIFAMITFAGRSAYYPSAEGGGAAFYLLIVPAIVAVVVIKLVKDKYSQSSQTREAQANVSDAIESINSQQSATTASKFYRLNALRPDLFECPSCKRQFDATRPEWDEILRAGGCSRCGIPLSL